MKRLLLIPIVLALTAANIHAASLPRYLQVHVYSEDSVGKVLDEMSLVYDLSSDSRCDGVYYIANGTSGITSDVTRFRQSGLQFELVFNLMVSESRISAATHALRYRAPSKPGAAERTTTEREFTLDESVLLCSYRLDDARTVFMEATALSDGSASISGFSRNAVTLTSTLLRDGKHLARERNVKTLLADQYDFDVRFPLPAGDTSGVREVMYRVQIRMPGAAGAAQAETQCEVTLMRQYMLSAARGGQKPTSQSTMQYSSRNTQTVTLTPGKELRLVFPPDVPAIDGFEIEDTLTIVPER